MWLVNIAAFAQALAHLRLTHLLRLLRCCSFGFQSFVMYRVTLWILIIMTQAKRLHKSITRPVKRRTRRVKRWPMCLPSIAIRLLMFKNQHYTNTNSTRFWISMLSPNPFSPLLSIHSPPSSSPFPFFPSNHSSFLNFYPFKSTSKSPHLHQDVPNPPSLGPMIHFFPFSGFTSSLYPSSLFSQNYNFSTGNLCSTTTSSPLSKEGMVMKSQSSRKL